MLRYISCVTVLLAVTACETEPFAPAPDERFVVQAYLYAGEPVSDVRITSTLPLGSTDSIAPSINDAAVALVREGTRYTLVPTPGRAGYYHYPGADLIIRVGDVFDLTASARGVTATARTTVPPPPDAVSLSASEMRMPPGGHSDPDPDVVQQVVVRWPNPAGEWYFITYQNVEPDPEPVTGDPDHPAPGRVVLVPTDADSMVIRAWGLTHYGRHEVRLYRVNPEYARLYVSRQQDTRDLNEPATNINNGLGVFSAFSSRITYFTLSLEQ